MGLAAVLLIGLAVWLIWSGRLQRMTAKDGMMLGVALVGAVLAAKGKPLIGAPSLGAVALYFALQGRRLLGPRRPSHTASPPDTDIAHARALLGLGADADEAAIRAAHRRLITSVHPDRGGTEALAAQINMARDLMLEDIATRKSGPNPRP
ncbi:MAG: molecular chaperone DnaJ [Sphingobium sp.]